MDENRTDTPKRISVFELRTEDALSKGLSLEKDQFTLESEIWIDGHHLNEPHFIDLPALIQNLYEEGWHDIFTCGCGVSGCAGIPEGIHVIHSGELIHWEFRRPLGAGNLLEPALSEWEKTARPVQYTFSRTQMLGAIRTFLDAARHLVADQPSRFEWPVYGLSVTDVLKIDPGKPYYEIRKGT